MADVPLPRAQTRLGHRLHPTRPLPEQPWRLERTDRDWAAAFVDALPSPRAASVTAAPVAAAPVAAEASLEFGTSREVQLSRALADINGRQAVNPCRNLILLSDDTAVDLVPPAGWQAPLVDLLDAMIRMRWLVILLLALGVLGGFAKLSVTPPYYMADSLAVLLPREKPHVDISVDVGSLKAARDGAQRESTGGLMLPANVELYTALAHSRPVLTSIADKFKDQIQQKDDDRSVEVTDRIKAMYKLTGTDEGLLTIEVTADDGQLAADLANEMTEEMKKASKKIERELVQSQAGFLGSAIDSIQSALDADEKELENYYKSYSIVQIGTQTSDVLRMIRETQMNKLALEQKLVERLKEFTSLDAGVKAIEERIAKYEEDVDRLRRTYFDNYSAKDFGRLQIGYEQLRNRVQFRRDLVATLQGQKSVFDIRAEQPAGSLAVIRRAVPPLRPAGPSKKNTIILFVVLSMILAVGLIVLFEQVRQSMADPYITDRVRTNQRRLGRTWLLRPFLAIIPRSIRRRLLV